MTEILPSPDLLATALAIAFLAGLVKGIIGFALPLVMVSGLSTLVSPHAALAGVVVPAIATNVWQALRQGPKPAAQSVWEFRRFLGVGLIVLIISAQFVPSLPERILLLALSIPVVLFAAVQLLGWRPKISTQHGLPEYLSGIAFGLFSGLAALFAPALVFYLTAIDTPKDKQLRVQGIVFLLAASFFCIAHIYSGLLTANALLFSATLLIPTLLGLRVGFWLHDHTNQKIFRTLTLVVLLISGLNLLLSALTL